MALIVNNFDYPVIAVDKRDWETSWANHRRRGSAGGADLAYPYGTPVRAPMAGVFTYTRGFGTGGNIGRIAAPDNTVVEIMHLSEALVANGAWVNIGDVFVKSGASGFGLPRFYAPHVHVHAIIRGLRTPIHTLFSGGTISPAGSIIKTPLEDTLSAAEVKSINDNTNARSAEVKATLANIESLLATEVYGGIDGGVRGQVAAARASISNVENILAKENNGGIRSLVSTCIGLLQRVVKKLGA
jgi:murein DD-endopeptidase MepM/ murein hydrolase activator NlpD